VHCIAQRACVGRRTSRTDNEGHLLLVFRVHRDLVISRITIQKAVILVPGQSLHHLINEWKRKVIFPGGGVQLAIVDADSPSRLYSSWDQLSFLVLHDRYSSSLGHDMNGAHPFAVRDWVDDASIQQLDYFSSDGILHGRVEPSLWLPRWFGVFL
jgi:hypothetical protein